MILHYRQRLAPAYKPLSILFKAYYGDNTPIKYARVKNQYPPCG
jgi:hypothetical protein